MLLTAKEIEDFGSQGYLLMSQLLSKEEILELESEARRIIDQASQVQSSNKSNQPRLHNILCADGAVAAPVEGRLSLHIEHVFRHSQIFNRLIRDARLIQIAASVCGSNLRFLDDQLYWKPASVGGSTYVHRDSDFFGPLRMATIWLPLCDVGEDNGCLWAIPGSHNRDVPLAGLRRRSEAPPGTSPDCRPFDFFYEVDLQEAAFASLPMQAGDVLILHRHLVHCSFEVHSARERLSYLIEYFAAEDYGRFRQSCSGLFDYDDRWRYMEPLQSAAE